jgi:hypothetical protein
MRDHDDIPSLDLMANGATTGRTSIHQAPAHDTDGLAALLRAAAATERPAFSPELHARLLTRIVPTRAARSVTLRQRFLPALAGGLIAAIAVALIMMPASVRPPVSDPAAGDDAVALAAPPGIEQLPSLAEVGEDMVASLTAALVDLPPWIAFVAIDPTQIMGDEDSP